MTVYLTSDQHFGHANIIRYCNRPFADVDHMRDELVSRWNRVVAPEDLVWVLGDVAMGRLTDSLANVSRLAGRKILVAGNHDRCWSGHGTKAARWRQRYLDAGFDDVVTTAVISIEGTPVRLHHFPYAGDSHDADRYVAQRPVDDGGWLAHGHVHERWRVNGRQINVGCDVWDYTPVAESTLASLIGGSPED